MPKYSWNTDEYKRSRMIEIVEQQFQKEWEESLKTIHKIGEKLLDETDPEKKKELEENGKEEEKLADDLLKLRKNFDEGGHYARLWDEHHETEDLEEEVSKILARREYYD